jgi:putative tricarboxylic transport membrane protein
VNRDVALGGVALALAVVYYLMARAIPSSFLADAVGPQGLPQVYAYVLAGLSILLIVRSLGRRESPEKGSGVFSAKSSEKTPDSFSDERASAWRVAGLLGIGAVYVAIVSWLGYTISLAALMIATTYYQGGGISRRSVAIAVSGAVALWLLFVVLLGISQPPGFWPTFF